MVAERLVAVAETEEETVADLEKGGEKVVVGTEEVRVDLEVHENTSKVVPDEDPLLLHNHYRQQCILRGNLLSAILCNAHHLEK